MEFAVFDLGLIELKQALAFQEEIFFRIDSGRLAAALILCRHYPVITLGRLAKRDNILASEQDLASRGIKVYAVQRGGDVTYHGPGQLMAYPLANLKLWVRDIHWFLRRLEAVVVAFLAHYGLRAETKYGYTGVWVADKKICSIGITLRRWITLQGLGINLKKDDLQGFSLVRPCGMEIKMTSLESVSGEEVNFRQAGALLADTFRAFFEVNLS